MQSIVFIQTADAKTTSRLEIRTTKPHIHSVGDVLVLCLNFLVTRTWCVREKVTHYHAQWRHRVISVNRWGSKST